MIEKVDSFIKSIVDDKGHFKATSSRPGDGYLHVGFRHVDSESKMYVNIGDDGKRSAIVLNEYNDGEIIGSEHVEVEREYAIEVVNKIIFQC